MGCPGQPVTYAGGGAKERVGERERGAAHDEQEVEESDQGERELESESNADKAQPPSVGTSVGAYTHRRARPLIAAALFKASTQIGRAHV